MAVTQKNTYDIKDLQSIMERLLSEDGCNWDKEQTLETLIPYLIEETYEVVDALEHKGAAEHCDELGDLLFQIIFQSALRQREEHFGFSEVVDGICQKLVRRHPHVFDKSKKMSPAEVEAQWEEIKKTERGSDYKSLMLDKVAACGPAMVTALKYSKKAAKVGFDWPSTEECMGKVEEEIEEIKSAGSDLNKVEEEIGDLLFAVVSLARKHGVDPSKSLRRANHKFRTRFNHIEKTLKRDSKSWQDTSLSEMDGIWNEFKKLHE